MPTWLSDGSAVITGQKGRGLAYTGVLPTIGPVPALADKLTGVWKELEPGVIIGPHADHEDAPTFIGRVNLDDPSTLHPFYVDMAQEPLAVDCHDLQAGGGSWLALGARHQHYGTWADKDGIGRFRTSGAGELVCCPTTDNAGLAVYRPGASTPAFPPIPFHEVWNLSVSGRTVLVCATDRWQVISLDDGAVVATVPRVPDGLPAEFAGRSLVWNSPFGLAIRDWRSTSGWLIAETATDFWPEAFARPDGLISIATSRAQSDAPANLQRYEADPDQGLVRPPGGAWRQMRAIDFTGGTPMPPPDPTPTSACLPALPNKCWISPFFCGRSARYPGPRDVLGNAVTLVGDERDPAVLLTELAASQDAPVICAAQDNIQAHLTNVVVAWWCSGADLTRLAAHVAVARALPEKAIWAYLDNRNWPTARPGWIDDRVLPSVQCYLEPHESLAEFEAAMQVVLEAVAGYGRPMVLTVQAYDRTRGQAAVDQAVAAMPLIRAWCDRYPIVGLHFFADRRPGGMTDHPALRAWFDAFLRANPARPNRFDHWGETSPERLLNKLGQSTPLIAFTDAEKGYLRSLLDDTPMPPAPPPPPPPGGEPWRNRLEVAVYVDQRHPQLLQPARDAAAAARARYDASAKTPADQARLEEELHAAEQLRGPFVDQLAHELNRRDRTDRWGRKARREGDASSLNDDALTYRLSSAADKKLVDVVAGEDFRPTWDLRPGHEEPGNGFWHPPVNPDLG